MKEKARSLKKDLFVVDTGDTHDGNGLSDTTSPHGEIMNEVIEDTYHNFIPKWNGRYLASNVYYKDLHNGETVPFGDKYTYFEGEFGTRVLAFGFLFDFKGNGNMSVIQKAEEEIKEPWFTETLTSHTPDVVVLIGHAGIRLEDLTVVRNAIRDHYPYIPITVLGGHLHIRDFAVYDEWSAGIASGRFMESVGFFSIQGIQQQKFSKQRLIHQSSDDNEQYTTPPENLIFNRRYLDQNRATYIFHSTDDGDVDNFDTHMGKSITKNITKWRNKLDLVKPIGCAPQDYYRTDVPVNDTSSIYTLTINEVLPIAIKDETRSIPPFFIFDTGTTRFDIYKGAFTLDNVEQVSPFINGFQYIPDIPTETAVNILIESNKAYFGDGHTKKSTKRFFNFNNQFSCEDVSGFQSYLDRSTILIPGYTTSDDLGTDGDDTKHIRRPEYELPHFVGSKLPDSPTVDIVFTDYSGPYVKNATNKVLGKQVNVEPVYGDPEIKTDTMWIKFAKKQWAKNCP
ncbi:5'-nucleotidase [Phascolomyces articulosus]|uniref:5'-nucleotidase n=1 Tax=Phascolomyces articulosus TaxID=60185 RepID=A0AAD5PHW0_9FUNG|nr:5'-nucleotidase [Phascolomyces articulosus]